MVIVEMVERENKCLGENEGINGKREGLSRAAGGGGGGVEASTIVVDVAV